MIIRCWGARGSIPVSGKQYLKYGGSTTCMEVRTRDDEIIIIDAGTGIKELGNKLIAENRNKYSLILTHYHWDHILGFPFFKPVYREGTHINILGCACAQESVQEMIAKTMAHPNFPVEFEEVKSDITYLAGCEEGFSIESIKVTPIILSHPCQGMGYKFDEDGKSFVFITDNELTYQHPGGLEYQDYLKFSTGADLLIHDSEFTEEEYKSTRTWGHSVYTDALKLAMEAGVKRFGLFHHNQDRTDDALDKIVENCQHIIENNNASLQCFAVYEGMEIQL